MNYLESATIIPSTRPLLDGYEMGPDVEASACDDANATVHLSDLIWQAQGDYDAMMAITLEQRLKLEYRGPPNRGVVPLDPAYLVESVRCYELRGKAIRLPSTAAAPEASEAP